MEEWRDIKGYEGIYQVSSIGNVRNIKTNRVLKQHLSSSGYPVLNLCLNGVAKKIEVHRLVAMAFIQNPDGLETVNHINEIKTDNRVENLEWMSRYDNLNYGTHNQRMAETLSSVKKKAVIQYSLNNELIKVWLSARDIMNECGYRYQKISECCLGKRKTTYGYRWEYVK